MTLSTDERRTIDEFKVAISLIKTGPEGFPLPDQGLELQITASKMLAVETIYLSRVAAGTITLDELDPEAKSLLNLAAATSRLIAAIESGEFDPDIPEAWFKARAELVEPSV